MSRVVPLSPVMLECIGVDLSDTHGARIDLFTHLTSLSGPFLTEWSGSCGRVTFRAAAQAG